MTKERRIAIKIWEEIRFLIEHHHIFTEFEIVKYKYHRCVAEGFNWRSGCWFCQYVRRHGRCNCDKCPLAKCNPYFDISNYEIGCDTPHSDYLTVINETKDTSLRVEACSRIIAYLKGEQPEPPSEGYPDYE